MSTTEEPRSYFSLPYIQTGKIIVRASAARDGFVSFVFADDLTLWTDSAEFARELVRAGAEALKILDPPRPVPSAACAATFHSAANCPDARHVAPEPEGYPCTRCGATDVPKIDGRCNNHTLCDERLAALRRDLWRCEDCGWTWPLKDVPSQDAECDACGGTMTKTAQDAEAAQVTR